MTPTSKAPARHTRRRAVGPADACRCQPTDTGRFLYPYARFRDEQLVAVELRHDAEVFGLPPEQLDAAEWRAS